MLLQKEIVYNNKRLVYHTIGQGPCVVLLHGFAEDSRLWQNQYTALPGYQLLLPDLPGSGDSDMVEDMSMEGLAKSVQAILQQEHIDKCILIGHSMGGYVALAFASLFGEQLLGLGLFHSTAYADSDEKKVTRQKAIQFIEKNGVEVFLKNTTPNLFSPATKEENPSLIEQQLEDTAYFSKEALIAYYTAMIQRPDRSDILQESKVPVLFILGEYDTAVPMADGLKQSHLPSVSYVRLFQHSSHMGMLEEPEKSNESLQAFLTMLPL